MTPNLLGLRQLSSFIVFVLLCRGLIYHPYLPCYKMRKHHCIHDTKDKELSQSRVASQLSTPVGLYQVFQKKCKQGRGKVEVILFRKNTGIFRFVILSLEIQGKKKLHPWKFHKIELSTQLLHPLEFLRPNKNEDPSSWKFHEIFS